MSHATKYVVASMLMLAVLATACAGAPTPTEAPKPTPTQSSAPTVAPPTVSMQPTLAPTRAASPVAGDEIRVVLVPEKSEARYRVREQLVGVSLPGDAVGATQVISGTIVGKMDGTIVSAKSRFRVDLRTLKSDQDRRDNFLRRNTLETDRFPFAEFVPTAVRGVPSPLPTSGEVTFQLVGDLTIRDVTRQVVWDVKVRLEGSEATGQAKTSFTFASFNLTKPQVPVVLSVEDTIRLEVDLYLRRE